MLHMYESAELGSTDGDDNVLTYCMQTWKKELLNQTLGKYSKVQKKKRKNNVVFVPQGGINGPVASSDPSSSAGMAAACTAASPGMLEEVDPGLLAGVDSVSLTGSKTCGGASTRQTQFKMHGTSWRRKWSG